jgi:hypothetical protein
MKTKLLAFVFVLAVLIPHVHAQKRRKTESGFHYAVVGGAGLNTLSGKDFWGDPLNNLLNPGFHAGTNVIISIIGDIWLQPGVMFSVKGTRKHIISGDITKTINLGYLEVPLNVLFRPQLGDGHMLLGLGPYVSYGLTGNERTKINTVTTELKVKYLADASGEPSTYVYYRGLDAGAGLLIGYEFYSGLFTHLNGQTGLLKLNSDFGLPNDQTVKRNLGFGLSAGFRF